MALLDVDDELDDDVTTRLFLLFLCLLCLSVSRCCLVEAEGFLCLAGGVLEADETTRCLSCTLCLSAPLCCLVEAEGFLRLAGGVLEANETACCLLLLFLCIPLCCLVEAECFLRLTGGVLEAEADWLELSTSLDEGETFLRG